MNFTLTLKQKVVTLSLIGLGLFLVFIYSFLIQPKMRETKKLRNQIMMINNQIQNINKIVDVYLGGKSALEDESEYYQNKYLASQDQVPQILSNLGEAARLSSVEVVSVRPDTTSDQLWHGVAYQKLPVSLQLEGSYIALVNCLKRFLDIPFLVDISKVKFTKGSSQQVVMNLELGTFFLNEH